MSTRAKKARVWHGVAGAPPEGGFALLYLKRGDSLVLPLESFQPQHLINVTITEIPKSAPARRGRSVRK